MVCTELFLLLFCCYHLQLLNTKAHWEYWGLFPIIRISIDITWTGSFSVTASAIKCSFHSPPSQDFGSPIVFQTAPYISLWSLPLSLRMVKNIKYFRRLSFCRTYCDVFESQVPCPYCPGIGRALSFVTSNHLPFFVTSEALLFETLSAWIAQYEELPSFKSDVY